MNKQQFLALLHSVLEEKKQNKKNDYSEPYDALYNTCVLGYDISYTKKVYEENKLFIKTEQGFEGSEYLKDVLTSLIDCYGKDAIAQTLREL